MFVHGANKGWFHLVMKVRFKVVLNVCILIQSFILACLVKSVFDISKSLIRAMALACHTQDSQCLALQPHGWFSFSSFSDSGKVAH